MMTNISPFSLKLWGYKEQTIAGQCQISSEPGTKLEIGLCQISSLLSQQYQREHYLGL